MRLASTAFSKHPAIFLMAIFSLVSKLRAELQHWHPLLVRHVLLLPLMQACCSVSLDLRCLPCVISV
jgi:hypothetical protein